MDKAFLAPRMTMTRGTAGASAFAPAADPARLLACDNVMAQLRAPLANPV